MADDYMDAMRPCPTCHGERWTDSPHVCPLQYHVGIRAANAARQVLWNGAEGKTTGPLYAATELAGEVGEVCNIVKKLERETRGLVGSRATVKQLEDEIGDVFICLDLLASEYGIDVMVAAARKFNKTSEKLGFPIRMVVPPT